MKTLIMSALLILTTAAPALAETVSIIECLIPNSPRDFSAHVIDHKTLDTPNFFDKNLAVYLNLDSGKVITFNDDSIALRGIFQGQAFSLNYDLQTTEQINTVLRVGSKTQNIECFMTEYTAQ